MRIIDFDAPFHRYLTDWMRENAGRFRNAEAMEEQAGEIYLRFINRRADWLDGRTPADYFAAFEDADELVRALAEYEAAGVSVPELMLSRIVQLGEPSVKPLLALVRDEQAGEAVRQTALNLLIELDTTEPMDDCFRLIDRAEADDALAEVASELLQNLGAAAVPGMLERLDCANEHALAIYLDLLCNFPGDERIYTYTMREFLRRHDRRALFASLLSRLGDARALEALGRVIQMEDLGYLDYLEIANAIEALGGEPGARDRDFTGDPYYESLARMQ
ncbi:MAG: hypothetical protein VB067_02250 [Christensenellaceae bacterium]|nr:hypothetical protein [Christensenellaceae bacterium]MEA5066697.1 hypothetical protein [Eubacteriales bacterium]MEA5067786.1 hypothetical protein [Christensenellaceae bacterium]